MYNWSSLYCNRLAQLVLMDDQQLLIHSTPITRPLTQTLKHTAGGDDHDDDGDLDDHDDHADHDYHDDHDFVH